MNTEQAIRVFSEILENKGKISRMTYIKPIYIRLAIAALRAQQERENAEYVVEATGSEAVHILKLLKEDADKKDPKPLTLDELKERVGKPYYHVELNYSDKWWGIMRKDIAEHPKDYHYGDWWLAYDHEPKELKP